LPLNIKSEEQIASELVSEFASQLGLDPSLTSGDPLLAIAQGDATQINFIQALCKKVYIFSRSTTATGEDLDSWMAQFDFARLPAVKARGQVRLSLRIARADNVTVPIGKVVQTPGGAIKYSIVADPTQTAWSDANGAYIIQAGQTSIIATVEAPIAGSAYNVQPNQISQFSSSNTGADDVLNTLAITNGLDAESDTDVRNRFILYINSLSKNTRPSISAAIMSVQQAINFNLVENFDQNGSARNGFFTVVIDDGSGDPPEALLTRITQAVERVRGFTIAFVVVPATKVTVAATLNIKVNPDVNSTLVQTKAQLAIVSYINSLKIGQPLYVYNLIEIAKAADPDNIYAVQINSVKIDTLELDKVITQFEVIRTIPANVTVGSF